MKLLIVEDNTMIYDAIIWRLEHELTTRDMDVKIERAKTLTEAKSMLRSFAPSVVSTDMAYPLERGMPEGDAGVRLITYIQHHHNVPCVVYSSSLKGEIERRLYDAGISDLPPVFEKSDNDAWSCKLADLLLEHQQ